MGKDKKKKGKDKCCEGYLKKGKRCSDCPDKEKDKSKKKDKDMLGITCKARLVESRTITRSEGKAKRVIDNRKQ